MRNIEEILLEKHGFSATPHLEEKAKLGALIAQKAQNGQRIGFGSGSTSFLTAIALGKRKLAEGLSFEAVVTSRAIADVCEAYGIPTRPLKDGAIDWYFDGADEVDGKRNLIKGLGGMLLKEKLVMKQAKETYILVDQSKFVRRLGEKCPVPVEVVPMAKETVAKALKGLGAQSISLREKDGVPFVSESGNLILDARFTRIDDDFEARIDLIVGVVENGLFLNYPLEIVTL